MALTYTTDELIISVRNRGSIPNNATLGTDDASIIRYLNEELISLIVPALMKVREEYLVVTENYDLGTYGTTIHLPSRAVGQKLRNVAHVDASGSRSKLEKISRENMETYDTGSITGTPSSFYIEGNRLVLMASSVSGTLELSYYMRPSQLVLLSEARQIATVALATRIVTFASAAPAAWTTSHLYDIHSVESGADIKSWDLAAVAVAGSQIELSDAINGTVAGTQSAISGDYVCLASECVVPAIPKELHPVLAQAALVRCKEALGDFEGMQAHRQTLSDMLQAAVYMVDNRVEGSPQRIINRHSIWWAGRSSIIGDW